MSTRGSKSLIRDIVPSALAAVRRTIQVDLPYESVPTELLRPSSCSLDLSQWSIILTDDCLATITSHQQLSTRQTLTSLNLSGAEKVSDRGIHSLSPCIAALQTLYVDNAYQISSDGLSVIAKYGNKLQNLSLAGCLKIDGVGFAIIGQGCRELRHLNLSGCRQVKPWSLMKIFDSCKQIETLDVSYCSMITDDEIKILSESCRGLRRINLRECKLVSDVGLTFLSQGCPDLLEINLRRSEMPFRITDVALLQLGQGCQSLVSINLHGCEMVSDTGLSWLSSWLKDLRHIDLSHCSKITNSGMRLLGEGCKNLRSIVLLNVKRVGDVGIRYLATECCHLERLDASGLSMLSMSIELLPSKHLNLHACPQVCNLSLIAISNFGALESLDLSGTKLTLAGASHIGKKCRRLVSLSLASCGDCLSNALFEALILRLSLLKIVNLSFCRKISNRSFKALSKCQHLQTLDLTGCTAVSDQSILFLCEGAYISPGLRNLLLAGCTKVTDTALSWIADGLKTSDGSLSLETLSLKGTRVTLSAMKGIQVEFTSSSLRSNESYLGAWPLSRVDDRKIIKLYHKRACAVAKIQALVRSRQEKDTLQRAREEYARKRVALRIGALLRGRKARGLFKRLKLARKQQQVSCIKLQCAFRCYSSKKAMKRLHKQKFDRLKPQACKVIQKHYRGVLGRRKAARARHEAILEGERRHQAAVQLQAWSRMLIARRIKAALGVQFLHREARRLQSAISIQCIWRAYAAKRNLAELKVAFVEQRTHEFAAASRIYAIFRHFGFRKAIKLRIATTQERSRCALAIQLWYHQVKEDIRRRIIAKREELALRIQAAVLLQRNIRKRAAYLLLLAAKKARDEILALRDKKAHILCHFGRLCIATNRMQTAQKEFEEEVKRVYLLSMWASTKITAAWRGKLGRDMAKEARIIRAQRWKALWSDEQQIPFYYNLDTGETRWEIPQVLLEIQPKPVCCNCFNYQAEMECRECEEFYCTNCFECIHLGGRRSTHHYKTVYDYFGRRKDLNLEPWTPLSPTQR